MDLEKLQEAKNQIKEHYKPRIDSLGYILNPGIDKESLQLRIQLHDMSRVPPDDPKLEEILDEIFEVYQGKGYNIHVKFTPILEPRKP